MITKPEIQAKQTKLRGAAWHSVIYGLGSIAQSAMGFLLLPILTGALSKDDFGAYSLILMATTVASAVFYLGMTSAMPRSFFDYQSEGERRAVFTTAFSILAIGAFLQMMAGYWGGDLIATTLMRKNTHADAVRWAFCGGALAFINQYFFTYLRLLRSSVAAVCLSLVSLICGLGFTLWLLDRYPGSVAAPFEAVVFSQLLVAAVFALMYGRQAFTWKLRHNEVRLLLHFGIASVITSFGNMLLDWADRIIIERFMTSADVGIYSAAVRVGSLVNVLLVVPFTQIWSPLMMEHRDDKNIRQLFSAVFSYFFIAGGLILSGAALFFHELLPILIRYDLTQDLAIVFLMVASANLVYGSTNIVVAGIFYERKVFLLPFVYYSIAIVKIIMDIILIPVYGIIAASTATLITSILLPTVVYGLAKKYFSFKIEWLRMFKLTGIFFIPFLYAVLVASKKLSEAHWSLRIVLMLFAILMVFQFVLTRNEKIEFKKTLHKLRYQ